MALIVILFMTSAPPWAGFEQAGSFFSLFADRHTIRTAGWLGSLWGKPDWEIPASWFQSINPIFIITLAPVMAGVWVRLGRRNLDPSIPAKFGLGLIFLALGFVVMMGAAVLVAAGHKVWPTWLISIYLIHTFGELCLSPVGLSSVTKLAPTRLTGQMLGTWFVASSLGSLLMGRIAGEFSEALFAKLAVAVLADDHSAGARRRAAAAVCEADQRTDAWGEIAVSRPGPISSPHPGPLPSLRGSGKGADRVVVGCSCVRGSGHAEGGTTEPSRVRDGTTNPGCPDWIRRSAPPFGLDDRAGEGPWFRGDAGAKPRVLQSGRYLFGGPRTMATRS